MLMETKLLLLGAILFVLSRVMKKLRDRIKPGFKKVYNEAYEWIETGWSAVLLAAFLMYFFVQGFVIPSGSMRMTLQEGDHLFVNKFIYGFHIPFAGGKRVAPLRQVKRGDIIVFKCPPAALTPIEREKRVNKDFVKRAMGLPGDVIEIKNKKLYVNGQTLDEPYVQHVDPMSFPKLEVFPTSEQYQRAWESGKFDSLPYGMVRDNFGPVIVPPGHYFGIGDNRDNSSDSRFWGPVPGNNLKGKPIIIYWPFNRVHTPK